MWKPKAPALGLAPPGIWKRHEWMDLAKAMLQHGMTERRWPVNQAFTRALSRIAASTPERIVNLKQKFRLVDERKHVILPMRRTAKMRILAEPHIDKRTTTRRERSDSLTEARRIETMMAIADFEVKEVAIAKAHSTELGQEKAGRLHLRAEAHRLWADFRKESGIPAKESEWEVWRQAVKEAFKEAAEEVSPSVMKEEPAEEHAAEAPFPAPTAAQFDMRPALPTSVIPRQNSVGTRC